MIGNTVDTGFVDKVCRDVEAHSPKKSHGETFLQNIEQMVAFSTDILDANSFKIKKEALDYAKDVMPKCRLESIPHKYHHICNKVWLDVGHNPDAINTVLSTLKASGNSRIAVVYGGKSTKDHASIIQVFLSHKSMLHSIHPCLISSQTPSELQDIFISPSKSLGLPTHHTAAHIHEQLSHICHTTNEPILDGILVIGSFHLMAHACRYFDVQIETDDFDMNDTYRFK